MFKNSIYGCVAVFSLSLLCSPVVGAQDFGRNEISAVEQLVQSSLQKHMEIGKVKVNSMVADGNTIVVDLNENFGQAPFTHESVAMLKNDIKQQLGSEYANSDVKITIQGNDIELYFADFDESYSRKHGSFITPQDPNRHYGKGLDKNVIALWQSHGWYFEPTLNRWEWQRGRLMQTVEDMYTQSYVVPFLIPMLENAGAYVWDARERDTHSVAVVVDNDGAHAQNGYTDANGKKK